LLIHGVSVPLEMLVAEYPFITESMVGA